MSINSYQELNLKEGASINEIKAAFRKVAKTCHPDAVGQAKADVEKFIKAQSAYQKLMKKAMAHNKTHRNERKPATFNSNSQAGNWRFISRREVGLDVYFRIYIQRPQPAQEMKITLPWQSSKACPRCLGQGRTLAKVNQGPLYRPCVCSKCSGKGYVNEDSRLEVKISAGMSGKDKIRLRKAGLYNPKEAERGDMILETIWVDKLPGNN